MSPQTIESIMAELSESDPLDFADLSIHEADARHLMANHLCDMDEQLLAAGLQQKERLAFMAAVAAHALGSVHN